MKKIIISILSVISLCLIGIICYITYPKNIKVEVKGEVLNPDVYVLKKGSTIKELIDKAGGVKEGVDTYTINMTKVLDDGDVVVMYKDEKLEGLNYKVNEIVNDKINPKDNFAFYIEVSEENYHKADILGMSIYDGEKVYILDKESIIWALNHDIHSFCQSYVESKKDIIELKEFVEKNNKSSKDILYYGKVETKKGITTNNNVHANSKIIVFRVLLLFFIL